MRPEAGWDRRWVCVRRWNSFYHPVLPVKPNLHSPQAQPTLTMRTTIAFGVLSFLATANATPLLVARLDECNPGGGSHGGGAVIPSYCYSSASSAAATYSAYASPSNMAPSSTSKCLPSTTSTHVTDPCNSGGGSHGGGAILPSYCFSSSTSVPTSACVSPSDHAASSTSEYPSASPSPTAPAIDECNPGGGWHGGGAVLPPHCSSSSASSSAKPLPRTLLRLAPPSAFPPAQPAREVTTVVAAPVPLGPARPRWKCQHSTPRRLRSPDPRTICRLFNCPRKYKWTMCYTF